jgi:RNA polymerase sigma factor (sigma-70 family)
MNRGHGRALEPHDEVDDGELLQRVRAGDDTAYGELWARHVRSARRVAAGLVPASDVEDIVSEAFERTLAAIRAGNGPLTSFRSYVAQTMRARAATMYARTSRVSLSENNDDLDVAVEDPDPFLGAPARGRVVQAFQELPPRWQQALWVSVVESEPPRRVADQLGTSPNGVSALVIRARRRLRANFIDLSAAESRNPLCSKAIAAPRRHAEHLNSCDHCGATLEGLADLDVRLNAGGAGLVAAIALVLGRLRAGPGWARNACAAAPVKAAGALVVVTTAGAVVLSPLAVHPPGHEAARRARPSAAAATLPSRPIAEAAGSEAVPRPHGSALAPARTAPPAPRHHTDPAAATSPRRVSPVPQRKVVAARPEGTTSGPVASPPPGPDAPQGVGSRRRVIRPLTLQAWSPPAFRPRPAGSTTRSPYDLLDIRL